LRKHKIAFLTSIDPRNKGALSGSSHFIHKALQKDSKKCKLLFVGVEDEDLIGRHLARP